MSDKDIPYFLGRIMIYMSFVLAVLLLSSQRLTATESVIVSKIEFPSDCIDDSGNTYTHLNTWTQSIDGSSCNRRTCYSGALETTKWKILENCITEIDIFDTTNCQYVNDDSLTFPDCCPTLQCSTGAAIVDDSAACRDLSSTTACETWKNETSCVTNANPIYEAMYNLTLDFCRLTCGYCTP